MENMEGDFFDWLPEDDLKYGASRVESYGGSVSTSRIWEPSSANERRTFRRSSSRNLSVAPSYWDYLNDIQRDLHSRIKECYSTRRKQV